MKKYIFEIKKDGVVINFKMLGDAIQKGDVKYLSYLINWIREAYPRNSMLLNRDIFDSIIQLLIIFIQNIKSLSKNDKFIRSIISLDADEKFAIISTSNDIYKLIQDILAIAMDKEEECEMKKEESTSVVTVEKNTDIEMDEDTLFKLDNRGSFINCVKLVQCIKSYDDKSLITLYNYVEKYIKTKEEIPKGTTNVYIIIEKIISHIKVVSGSESFLNWLSSLGNKVSIDDQLEEKIVSEIDNLLEENKKAMRNITKIMHGDYELDKLLYDMRFDENMIQFNFKLLAELIKNKDTIGLGTFISHIQDKCGDDIIYTNTVKLLQLIKDNIEILSEDEEIIEFFNGEKTYANAYTMSTHIELITRVINKSKKSLNHLRNMIKAYDDWNERNHISKDFIDFIGVSKVVIENNYMKKSVKNLFTDTIYQYAKDNNIWEVIDPIDKIKELNDIISNSTNGYKPENYLDLYNNIIALYNAIGYVDIDTGVDLFKIYSKFMIDNLDQTIVHVINSFSKAYDNYCKSLNNK